MKHIIQEIAETISERFEDVNDNLIVYHWGCGRFLGP
jgi:uncharacterized protein YPO0396